jgi:type I restriction enzyme R subunit
MRKVTAGKSFTEEQTNWLALIRGHMIQNLTIDLSDFEDAPIFAAKGGLGRARKVFTGDLEALIEEFNYAMAA